MAYIPIGSGALATAPPKPPGYIPIGGAKATALPITTSAKPSGFVGVEAMSPALRIQPKLSSVNTTQPAYGGSSIKDTSGAPLLTFRNDAQHKSQLLDDRVFSGDPTVAKPGSVHNPRMDTAVSGAIKKLLGGTSKQELDHTTPLELGGSNQQSNLRLESGKNPNINYSPSNPTPTDAIENRLGSQVKKGQLSQVQAWDTNAQAKGITLPENKQTYIPIASPTGGKSTMPQQPSKASGVLGMVSKGLAIANGIRDFISNPSSVITNPLSNQINSKAASVVPKAVSFVKSQQGVGLNQFNQNLSDAVGGQAVEHPVATFKKLNSDLWKQTGYAEQQVIDSFKQVNADVEGHGAQTKTEKVANLSNLLTSAAGLVMSVPSIPFQIGSQLPVFKPAFDALGVVFDQSGKIASYNADKMLQLVPDAILSKEQKAMLAKPIHDVATLAGQLILGAKVLHEVTGLSDKKLTTPEHVNMLVEKYKQEAKDLNQHIDKSKSPAPETAEDFVASKEGKLRVATDLNNESLTTKILDKLKGKTTVSRQFIEDLTNSPDLKQSERDLIRSKLAESTGDKVDVQKFSDEVKAELLPLERKTIGNPTYENVSLPEESRGDVKNYSEHIYESPVITSAGDVHFSGETQNYFGHTRVEDLPDSTRRILEVQSDLYQKGRLEGEKMRYKASPVEGTNPALEIQTRRFGNTEVNPAGTRAKELAKLDPYQNNAAHFRMIREEVRQAALDGKTKLQFPTGETAMKIEGLGETNHWTAVDNYGPDLKPDDLKVGREIQQGNTGDDWIITDVLGDGKFKAVPKDRFRDEEKSFYSGDKRLEGHGWYSPGVTETFDISGKVDTANPIYKFYEKEVGRYLKNKYDAKLITDKQGVTWWEADIKPEHKGAVEAFRLKDDLAAKGIEITDAQEKEIIDLNKKMFGDADVKITGQILANKDALGKYQEGIIEILKGQSNPNATFYHEAVHKYLDVFTDKAEHAEILKEGAKKYGIDDFAQVEEKIAEDFIKYAETRTGVTGKLKTYFDTIINRIQSYLGNESKIDKLYTDIVSGKARESSTVAPKPSEATKITSAASNINKELVSKGFDALPEHVLAKITPIRKAEVLDKVAEFMTKDQEGAKQAAITGEVPEGIHPQVLFNAIEAKAYKDGDFDTFAALASSPIAEERSIAAQTLGASGFNQNPESGIAKLKEIERAQRKASNVKEIDKAQTEARKSVKEAVKKVTLPKEELDFSKFLDSIQC